MTMRKTSSILLVAATIALTIGATDSSTPQATPRPAAAAPSATATMAQANAFVTPSHNVFQMMAMAQR